MSAIFDWSDVSWQATSFTANGAVVYCERWPANGNHKNPYPMFGLRVPRGVAVIDLRQFDEDAYWELARKLNRASPRAALTLEPL